MPRFRLDFVLIALSMALLAISPVNSRAEDEPSYKDKKLSEWVQQLQKGDPIQRRAAAVALSKMGAKAKAATDPLATVYKDEAVATVRLRIAEALIAIDRDGKATLACLSDALVDEDNEVRQVAIDYFEEMGMAEALCKVLKHKKPAARLSAAHSLAKLGAGGKKAIQPLADAWKIEKDPKARREMLEALIAIDPEDKVTTGTSLEALTDSSDDVRKVALARVNMLPPEKVVAVLSQALEHQTEKIRLSAAQGLAKLGTGGKKAAQPLAAASRIEKDPKVRCEMLEALIVIDPDSAIPCLTEALNGIADAQLRLHLLKSLIAIDTEAKKSKTALNEALADKDPAVRQVAANQLITTQYRSSIPDLCKALELPSLEMRIGAARALGDLGPKAKDAIPSLNKALRSPNADERLIMQDVLFLIDPDSLPLAARELVQVLSDDTDLVVSLKIHTLLESVLVNKGFLKDIQKKLKNECPILDQFQFDPLKDVGGITVASGGIDPLKLDNGHFHVLLNGRFGKEKVFDIVKGQMFGRNGFAACLDEGAILVCDEQASLERAIDHKKKKSHAKPNAQLMKILARVDNTQTFWMAKAFSKQDGAFVKSVANEEIADSSLGLTLHINYKENATLDFRVFTSDPKTAAYWKEEVLKWRDLVIEALPALFQNDPKLAGQVKEVLESAKIETKASDLFVQFSIKADVLEKVAKRFQQ